MTSQVTVSEDSGSAEVVISATGASVSGNVTVGVSTIDQSAKGKSVVIHFLAVPYTMSLLLGFICIHH